MITRRSFIKSSSIVGGGLIVGLGVFNACKDKDRLTGGILNSLNSKKGISIGDFVCLQKDGTVFINLCKHEMGQGVSSGLTAILAEEMDADWKKVRIVYADPIAGISNSTGGSTSTLDQWDELIKAGAFIKNLLLHAAAQHWGVDKMDCQAENSFIYLKNSRKKIEYGELVDKITLPETLEEPQLKKKDAYKLIGKSFPNKIIPDIVTGRHPYGMDVRLPDMKYAAIERCPVFKGTLVRYDATEALAISGVEKVVEIKGKVLDGNTHVRSGLAVIANSTWAAFQGKRALIIEWNYGEKEKIKHQDFVASAFHKLAHEDGREALNVGETPKMQKTDSTFSQTYEFPYQHHACMEPLNATAIYTNNSCEIWTGTQSATYVMAKIEEHMGIPKENIKINCYPSGGGFGLRYWASYALEAVLVSKAAGGDLIKMCYTREDDIKCDYLNSYEFNKHTVLIRNDKPISWSLKAAIDNWGAVLGWLYYDIPHKYVEEVRINGFTQASAWRSVMANAEGFSTECFIDELAEKLNQDPLDFRLKLLEKDIMVDFNHTYTCNIKRLRNVLKLMSEKGNWGKKMRENSGQGIAVYPYMHGNGYGACIAEVSVSDKKIVIEKITIAIECGLIINPDFVKKQMEGGVIWALSAMFYGGTEYKNGEVLRSNFHDNKVLRIHEVPEIEVHLCESDENRPWGVGEIAPPVTYPAVCNAIYAATKKRIRKLPLEKNML
ncbi:molybdopterin cofactor-binding domain-containing protein [uncultured Aquimarina sp.]|uniref:xanthine dehydrogenase family protein molybdopterin-binding subunit n=1 Tax=uncultured Aquimarina sp. TaxID=575652 RepID=UPI00260B8B80|nr:molybdopterin cofactor-binding domain-containing protein [uncultured Aquimarina sp.]